MFVGGSGWGWAASEALQEAKSLLKLEAHPHIVAYMDVWLHRDNPASPFKPPTTEVAPPPHTHLPLPLPLEAPPAPIPSPLALEGRVSRARRAVCAVKRGAPGPLGERFDGDGGCVCAPGRCA